MFIKPPSNRRTLTKDVEKEIRPSVRRKSPLRSLKKDPVKVFKRKPIPFTPAEDVFKNEVVECQSSDDEEIKFETGEIKGIQFSFMSEKEIENFAVVEITETKYGGPNSLYDPKMGPLTKNDICETCDANWDKCPGHFGYIKLGSSFPHPLRSKNIVEYLLLFCRSCQRLVVTEDSINMLGFNKFSGEARYKKILNHVEKTVSICPCCNTSIPHYTFFDDKYMMEIKDKKYPVQYENIYNIFSNIRDCDIQLLGFNPSHVHPVRLMLTNLLVVPPCVRPYIRSDDGEVSHDDLTCKYIDIIKNNNKLKETTSEKTRLDMIDVLMFHIRTLMDNGKGKAREISGKRPIKAIKERLSSKQGRIRQNIQGKRVNFSARTVIGGDANCMVDELIIPPTVAKKLTYPVIVSEKNYDECVKLLNEGKVNTIFQDGVHKNAKYAMWSEGFKFRREDILIRDGQSINVFELVQKKYNGEIDKFNLKQGDKISRHGEILSNLPIKKRKNFTLNIGDTIERQLQNGDLVIFNRQPTLWKGSMRAKRVKILPGKTFRFNLASSAAFNADFDGDEMNLWLPQTEKSRAEAATILNTVDNFMSSQDSKPLLTLKQDAMTGGYVLTDGYVMIERHIFFECICHENFAISTITKKLEHIKDVYIKTGTYDRIKNMLLEKNKNKIDKITNKLKKLKEEHSSLKGKDESKRAKISVEFKALKEENEKLKNIPEDKILYNGHTLFSIILPDDFEYFAANGAAKDGSDVVVRKGVLLSGTLDKVAIGSSSGSLIHHIAKDYGYKVASDFVSYYQILINNWLTHYGYTIGLEDCIPKNTDLIDTEMNKCFLKSIAAIRTEKDEEMLENKITGLLNEAVTVGQKIAKEALKPDNNIVRVVLSGAKGNFFNITQVTGAVGQQTVNGNRIQKLFGGRTLPHYEEFNNSMLEEIEEKGEDPLPVLIDMFESRGFVKNSYFKGLTPQEYFFHAVGGREGLLDTSLKTANTGYIQRKMIKMLEDLKFDYTNVVSNSKNNVIEFMYGEDNLDVSKMIKTKAGLSFVDIAHINSKLNTQIELE